MPARPALTPQIRFLYIGSRVCSTLLSDLASRRRPCASLSLHLHQVVKRTFTFELSNMLGTHRTAGQGEITLSCFASTSVARQVDPSKVDPAAGCRPNPQPARGVYAPAVWRLYRQLP